MWALSKRQSVFQWIMFTTRALETAKKSSHEAISVATFGKSPTGATGERAAVLSGVEAEELLPRRM